MYIFIFLCRNAYNFFFLSFSLMSKVYFSSNGLLICLSSPTEFEVLSLSQSITTKPFCKIELSEDARLPIKPLENIVLDMQHLTLHNGHDK